MAKAKKISNQGVQEIPEGTLFLIPAEDGGYALALVARRRRRTENFVFIMFGGRRIRNEADLDLSIANVNNCILYGKIGSDVYISDGRWKTVGKVSPWEREKWPLPKVPLGRRQVLTLSGDKIDEFTIATLDDNDFMKRTSIEVVNKLPAVVMSDGVYGLDGFGVRISNMVPWKGK